MRNGLQTITLLLAILAIPTVSRAFDFGVWDDILRGNTKKSVCEGIPYTGFDYASLKGSKKFEGLLSGLESFSPDTLNGRNETIAFWINVYNIFAVKLVRDNYPLKGIRDAGSIFSSIWKKPAGKVGGKPYSLDEIEHGILRPMNEPGIHFALVCASVSCPDLRGEAYKGEIIEEQLRSQAYSFLRNRQKGMRMEPEKKTVHLSKIFDWYKEDFKSDYGVIGFLNTRMGDICDIPADFSIEHMPYNWELNAANEIP